MYFHAVKSTAHPPIIGALGHSTDFIVRQPNTATIKIDIYIYALLFCFAVRETLSDAEAACTNNQVHCTGVRKFEVCLAFNSDGVCRLQKI